ncbi:hypothetical protein GCM10010191_83480 [Actinomadura vinacea]|uniref:Aminoglycoside phosphotransferase domain-containing protein n=1 Tax=Actinomadura vinacea TaxID=115336 RepID=A0ABN3KBT7_9ACTN
MIGEIRAALARHLPHREFRSVVRLGGGLDNLAFEADGELIVRISKEPDPEALRREAETLIAVGGFSPLPVPVPVFVDAETGMMAYRKVPGVPLLGRPVPDPARLAPVLGEFLTVLHGADVEAPRDADPLSAWLDGAEAAYREAADHIPHRLRAAVERFLATAPPPEPSAEVFCHNDLGAEHILVDVRSNTVTGIIDWSDAAIADPMHDLARLYRDLGPEVFDLILTHYEAPCDRERVLFYARCTVLEDIAYGLTTEGARLYADEGLAHLSWTFAP